MPVLPLCGGIMPQAGEVGKGILTARRVGTQVYALLTGG